jgi:hypothetical protein
MTLIVAPGNMSVDIDTPSSHSRTCLCCMNAHTSEAAEVAEADVDVDPVDVLTLLALLWMDFMARIMATLQIGDLHSGYSFCVPKFDSCCDIVG